MTITISPEILRMLGIILFFSGLGVLLGVFADDLLIDEKWLKIIGLGFPAAGVVLFLLYLMSR